MLRRRLAACSPRARLVAGARADAGDEPDGSRASQHATASAASLTRPPRLFVLLVGLGLGVEALGGELADGAIPELDLEEEVVAEAVHRVDRDQREAPVGHRRLVERLAVELGRRGNRAADQRQPPDQRHVTAAAAVGAPAADHVVVDVDLPVGVVLGGDVGEVGLGAQVRRLAVVVAAGA